MYFKQILDERCGCASYLIASRQSHEAAIVDPSIDTAQYEPLLRERGDVVAEELEIPMEHVEADVGEGVSEVPGVVGRHAADVEADRAAAGDRFERMKAAPTGIVQAKGHAANSKAVAWIGPEAGRDR